MNKLLLLLGSFIASRALWIFIGSYTEGALASFVGCFLYILLFLLFSPRTRLERAPLGAVKALLTVALFLLISLAVSSFLKLFLETEQKVPSLLQGIIAVLLVPIAEELFFRATLFKMLDTLVTPTAACLASSLIFSLSHTGVASVIASFVSGVMLALIYKKTGSLRLPVICHSANNLLAFLLLKGF